MDPMAKVQKPANAGKGHVSATRRGDARACKVCRGRRGVVLCVGCGRGVGAPDERARSWADTMRVVQKGQPS